MQTQQTPQVLQQPFAAQGDKNTIPNAATGTNKASLQEGFPPITGQPINQGGIPPERQDFNGIMNLNSQFYFAFQNGWLPTFSQEVSDAIGGYPQGAVLWYQSSEGLQILESAIPDNTNNFITNPSVIGTSWISVAATAGDIALKADTDLSNCTKATQESINNIMPANMDYVVESGSSGRTWYRKYKSGWIEQGGYTWGQQGGDYTKQTNVTFLKAFTQTPLQILVSPYTPSYADGTNFALKAHNASPTGFVYFWQGGDNKHYILGSFWYACGK